MDPFSVRPSAELSKKIEERRDTEASPASVVRRDLDRYYTAIDYTISEIDLSEAEAMLICDVLNGTIMEPNSFRLLWAEVDDGIKLDGLDKKWEVDGKKLVSKLRNLTHFQTLAICDAVERAWMEPKKLRERVGEFLIKNNASGQKS